MAGRGNLILSLGIGLVIVNAIVSGEIKRIKSAIQNDWIVGGGADFGPTAAKPNPSPTSGTVVRPVQSA